MLSFLYFTALTFVCQSQGFPYSPPYFPFTPPAVKEGEQSSWLQPSGGGTFDWDSTFTNNGMHALAEPHLLVGWKDVDTKVGTFTTDTWKYADPIGVASENGDCQVLDWSNLQNEHQANACPYGYAIRGFEIQGFQLTNVKCCPGVTKSCYRSGSSNKPIPGWNQCQEGFAMTGLITKKCSMTGGFGFKCNFEFSCCRLANTQKEPKVLGYWSASHVGRKPVAWQYTVEKTVQTSKTDETAQDTLNAWKKEFQEGFSVEVGTAAQFEGMSAATKFLYKSQNTHTQEFSSQAHTSVMTSFSQKYDESVTIPLEADTAYNIWSWTTQGVQQTGDSFVTATVTDPTQPQWVTGCGYDVAPNCLPVGCSSLDKNCWQCTEPQYRIDPYFVKPEYDDQCNKINTARCGAIGSRSDAESKCGKPCKIANDGGCPQGEECFDGLSTDGCKTSLLLGERQGEVANSLKPEESTSTPTRNSRVQRPSNDGRNRDHIQETGAPTRNLRETRDRTQILRETREPVRRPSTSSRGRGQAQITREDQRRTANRFSTVRPSQDEIVRPRKL